MVMIPVMYWRALETHITRPLFFVSMPHLWHSWKIRARGSYGFQCGTANIRSTGGRPCHEHCVSSHFRNRYRSEHKITDCQCCASAILRTQRILSLQDGVMVEY